MKYWVRVGDQTIEVAIRDVGGRRTVLVDGRPVEAELDEGAPGIYTLLVDGKPHDLAAVPRPGGFALAVQGVPFDVEVEDERQRQLYGVSSVRAVAEGQIALRAPMPGRVGQVEVLEGDQVERGTRLLTLEAMKMENDITAPRAGRVEQVRAIKGQTVEQGQVLVVLV